MRFQATADFSFKGKRHSMREQASAAEERPPTPIKSDDSRKGLPRHPFSSPRNTMLVVSAYVTRQPTGSRAEDLSRSLGELAGMK